MQVTSSAEVRDREIGMILWAGRDSLAEVRKIGVRCGQLGVGGDVSITPEFVDEWKAAAATFPLYTVTAAYDAKNMPMFGPCSGRWDSFPGPHGRPVRRGPLR